MSRPLKASVVIATRNRKDELRRALASAVSQTEPVEILVLDDGSTDGTADMVRSEFPQVRLDQSLHARGYIAQRNRGAEICSGDIIFSIDDDAEFSTPKVIEQTLLSFSHPRIAAVAIPYVEPHKSRHQFQTAPNADAVWLIDSFRGTAHALRRDVFLKLGGYREQFIHQGEEMDFCIRLLSHGFVVRLGVGDIIVHHEYANRDWTRMDFYGRRNDILFGWKNVPMPYLPVHLLGTTVNGLLCAVRTRRPSAMIRGVMSGYLATFSQSRREPVSTNVYCLHRTLKKRGTRMLSDVEQLLPPMYPLEGLAYAGTRQAELEKQDFTNLDTWTRPSTAHLDRRATSRLTRTVPITVIIPTVRGRSIKFLLEKIRSCDPQPTEILVHIDGEDDTSPDQNELWPNVKVFTSAIRLGPGGGRHRCLLACRTPYAASFDDNSYPVDSDFFNRAWQLLSQHPRAAIVGATIWHRHEAQRARIERLTLKPGYVGCGYAIRVAAYRQVRGYLPVAIAYGMEESDLSLQLFDAGWKIYEAGDLRVLHDTDLHHHNSAEVTSAMIANVGLYVFLNYPFIGWGRGLAQVANKVGYCIKMGRFRGIFSGILGIVVTCYHYRRYRKPVSWKTLRKFLRFQRSATRAALNQNGSSAGSAGEAETV